VSTERIEAGTVADPGNLRPRPDQVNSRAWRDEESEPQMLVVQAGSTRLSYLLRALEDTVELLTRRKDCVLLGSADGGKPAASDRLEEWARDPSNPVGGHYGLMKAYRGRFANYVPPILERLGLVELEHRPRDNRVRAR